MGIEKGYRPVSSPGSLDRVQTLTGASTGTRIRNYGVTTITVTTGEGTAANLIYTLDDPENAGLRKFIVADLNSTKEVTVRTVSSGNTFFGSTKNSFTFSTGSTHLPSSVSLVGMSSVQWAVESINTPLASFSTTLTGAVTIAGATA